MSWFSWEVKGQHTYCSNFWVIHGDVKPLLATAY
jgi:hypothetical protein